MGRSKERGNDEFLRIYEQNKDSVLRTCYMLLKDYQLSEDAAQEVFYRVYAKLGTFKGKSDIKTWITSIALNVCKDKLKKKPHAELTEESVERIGGGEQNEIDNRLLIVGAITALPIELREVVVLCYYRELKQNEIAKILKIPVTTVAYRLRKAKEILKNQLEEDVFYE